MGSKSILAGLGLAAILMSAGGCATTHQATSQSAGSSSSGSSSGQGGYQNYSGGHAGAGGFSGRSGTGRHPGFGHGSGLYQAATAKALGITTQELATEMKSKTLAQIAAAHGISQAKVGSAMIADMKSRLDQMVTSGRIDQATENRLLAQFQKNLTVRLNAKPGQGGMMGGRGGPGGSYGGSPASTQ